MAIPSKDSMGGQEVTWTVAGCKVRCTSMCPPSLSLPSVGPHRIRLHILVGFAASVGSGWIFHGALSGSDRLYSNKIKPYELLAGSWVDLVTSAHIASPTSGLPVNLQQG